MKKHFITIILCSLLFPLNAQVINFFTPDDPDVFIKQNIQINFLKDTKDNGIGLSAITDVDYKELYGSFGFNLTNQQFDFTASVCYGPTLFDCLNVGLLNTIHFNKYSQSFTEKDYIIDMFVRWRVNSIFELYACSGLFYKKTTILALKDFVPDIEDKGLNFEYKLSFYPDDLWTLYTSFASSSYFNYPIFMCGFFSTGAEYKVAPDSFSIGVDLTAKIYDLVVVAQNISKFNIVVFGRYKI